MKWIEDSLRRKIGLDAASVGSSLIQHAIRLRMRALNLATEDAYRDWLIGSETEWEQLIEGVVVAETWFFRDREPFTAFIQLIQSGLETQVSGQQPSDSRLQPPDFSGVVRILSLPCSTGEEPYSLAMALLDAGVPRPRFAIDAVDLSARALERARLAAYGRNSFRGQSLEFRERHFSPAGDGWKLDPNVSECVQFHRGNLLEADFFAGRAPYDIIFCRNLLIYFDRITQAQALRKLDALLAPNGVLFVGPAELPMVSDRGFVSAGLPMAFACRKAAAATASPAPKKIAPRAKGNGAPLREFRVPSLPVPSSPSPSNSELGTRNSELPPPASGTPDLATARALADAGKLSEAAALCEAHLKSQGPSAQACYLLGLVTEARENEASGLKTEAGEGQKPKPTNSNNHNPEKLFTNSVAADVRRRKSAASERGLTSAATTLNEVPEVLSFGSPASRTMIASPFAVALDFYRKALYLDPNHHETLLQMSLLLEKLGDVTGAQTFRRRAADCESRLKAKGQLLK